MSDFEVLLINDGSTDNSPFICEKYAKKDKRVKVFHTTNSGPGKARNLGIQNAQGKYIMFIDSDDYIDPDTFKIVYNMAEINNLDLVVYPLYEKKGNVLEKIDITECQFDNKETKSKFLKEVWLKSGKLAPPVNKLYRSEIIRNYNIAFNEEYFIAEDYLFNIEYIDAAEKGVSINRPLYYYIRNNSSVSTKVLYNKYEIALSVYKESLRLLENYNIREKDYMNQIHEAYVTEIIRAMYEPTRKGFNKRFLIKLSEIKKCMIGKETRALLLNPHILQSFNKFVLFCIKYKLSFIFYIAFKISNTRKGI